MISQDIFNVNVSLLPESNGSGGKGGKGQKDTIGKWVLR